MNVTVVLLNAADLIGRAGGRVVVHKKNRFLSNGFSDSGYEDRDISPFVIRRDDQHWTSLPKCEFIMCGIGNPTRFSGSVVNYCGSIVSRTASADSSVIASGVCETQSSGVATKRSLVIVERGLRRQWLSSSSK